MKLKLRVTTASQGNSTLTPRYSDGEYTRVAESRRVDGKPGRYLIGGRYEEGAVIEVAPQADNILRIDAPKRRRN